jgi:hypothetical protein
LASFPVPGKKAVTITKLEKKLYNIEDAKDVIYRWRTLEGQAVRINAEHGDNTREYGCAHLPKDYVVEASEKNPQVLVSGVKPYPTPTFTTWYVAEEYKTGVQEGKICFTAECGHHRQFVACDAKLTGKMRKRITVTIEQ